MTSPEPVVLSSERYEVPYTPCIVLRVILNLEMGTRYEGVFQFIPDEFSGKRTARWVALYQPNEKEKWKITGEGATTRSGPVPDASAAPFSVNNDVNVGLIKYLRGLLCLRRGIKDETESKPVAAPKEIQIPTPRPSSQVPTPRSFSSMSGYAIVDFGLKTQNEGVFTGVASINNPKHRIEHYHWTATCLGDKQWKITGTGALLNSGGLINDIEKFPFSIYPPVNDAFKAALAEWLNQHHSNAPRTEVPAANLEQASDKVVQPKSDSQFDEQVTLAIKTVCEKFDTTHQDLKDHPMDRRFFEPRGHLACIIGLELGRPMKVVVEVLRFTAETTAHLRIKKLSNRLTGDGEGPLKRTYLEILNKMGIGEGGGKLKVTLPEDAVLASASDHPPATPSSASSEITVVHSPRPHPTEQVVSATDPVERLLSATRESADLARCAGIFIAWDQLGLDSKHLQEVFGVNEEYIFTCIGRVQYMQRNGDSSKVTPILDAIKQKL